MKALLNRLKAQTKVFSRWMCVIVCLGWAVPALAVPGDYFKAQVPVESQRVSARNQAAGIGLKAVFVRLSGMVNVASEPGVLKVLGKAGQYIEQYEYGRAENEEGQPIQVLNMVFAESVVARLLAQLNLPYWPTTRPNVLVWVTVDDPEQGKLMVNDPAHPAIEALTTAARTRGVPLLFPLLDLDDQFSLSTEQAWNLDEEALLNASERYGVETLLVGRLAQTSSGTWLTTWEFMHQDVRRVYDARGEAAQDVADAGLFPLADYLASLYAVRKSQEDSDQLYAVVDHVEYFEDFSAMVAYLGSLAVVSQFDVSMIDGAMVSVTLKLSGSIKQLHNVLVLDGKISAEALPQATAWQPVAVGTEQSPMKLYWQGRSG